MLEFPQIGKEEAPYREGKDRVNDFKEIQKPYSKDSLKTQASRCSQCGVPMCQVYCPLHNNIPDWLNAAARGDWQMAFELSSATNTFPEICGRICPQDRLCEGHCVIEKDFGSVTIGGIEKNIADRAYQENWFTPPHPIDADTAKSELSIGIIGSGPGGLAAAEMLRKKGYQVEIYEKSDRFGGLLVYGIPSFKLEKDIVLHRISLFEQAGIKFHRNIEIGKDISFSKLKAKHDALLIATGVTKPRKLKIAGSEHSNCIEALDYLITSNKLDFGDTIIDFSSSPLNARGKRVVVIGGGDTAMDCVRTAVRQGAKSVHCIYRRDEANMPGSKKEVKHAKEEGVIFEWLSYPIAYVGNEQITGVTIGKMHLGLADASGRSRPMPLKGYEETIPADLVIHALGFEAEDLGKKFSQPDLVLESDNTIAIKKGTKKTSLEGVFAAGDIIRGPSLVVWAIKDGRDAAKEIDIYLEMRTNPDYKRAH